jgi:hypothetical protein
MSNKLKFENVCQEISVTKTTPWKNRVKEVPDLKKPGSKEEYFTRNHLYKSPGEEVRRRNP